MCIRDRYYNGTASGEAAYSSRELRYLHHDKAIEGGMDFGNMLSLVIGQADGAYSVSYTHLDEPFHLLPV